MIGRHKLVDPIILLERQKMVEAEEFFSWENDSLSDFRASVREWNLDFDLSWICARILFSPSSARY